VTRALCLVAVLLAGLVRLDGLGRPRAWVRLLSADPVRGWCWL
jgi:hypothetical protein